MSNDLNKNKGDEGATPLAKLLFGWTTAKSAPNLIFVTLIVLSIALFALDFYLQANHLKHAYKPIEFSNMPMFYGLFGFAAFAFVVLCGWPLGDLLRKDENYYGDLDEVDSEAKSPTTKAEDH